MPKKRLRPNEVLMLEFEPTTWDPRVVFEVESDIPVTTLLVNDMGKEDYMDGYIPTRQDKFAGFKKRRFHQADVDLPNYSRYHLLVANDSRNSSARIEYSIKEIQ